MKIKLLVLVILMMILLKAYFLVASHPITHFLLDGREKVVMYYNITPQIIHIDIECTKPKILWEDNTYEAYENINIYFFPSDCTLMYTIGNRYIKLQNI